MQLPATQSEQHASPQHVPTMHMLSMHAGGGDMHTPATHIVPPPHGPPAPQ